MYIDNSKTSLLVHHSIETVLVKILNDIHINNTTVLILLNHYVALVNHTILLERLKHLAWLLGTPYSGLNLTWMTNIT